MLQVVNEYKTGLFVVYLCPVIIVPLPEDKHGSATSRIIYVHCTTHNTLSDGKYSRQIFRQGESYPRTVRG